MAVAVVGVDILQQCQEMLCDVCERMEGEEEGKRSLPVESLGMGD